MKGKRGKITTVVYPHHDKQEQVVEGPLRFWLTNRNCIQVEVDDEGYLKLYATGPGPHFRLAVMAESSNSMKVRVVE